LRFGELTQLSEGWINHPDQFVNIANKPSEGFIFPTGISNQG